MELNDGHLGGGGGGGGGGLPDIMWDSYPLYNCQLVEGCLFLVFEVQLHRIKRNCLGDDSAAIGKMTSIKQEQNSE